MDLGSRLQFCIQPGSWILDLDYSSVSNDAQVSRGNVFCNLQIKFLQCFANKNGDGWIDN